MWGEEEFAKEQAQLARAQRQRKESQLARTGIVSAGPASGAGSGETVELYVTLPEGATEGAEVGCHIPEGIPGAGGYFVLKVERGWKPGLRVVQRIRVQYATESAPEVTGGSESAAVSDSHSLPPLPPLPPLPSFEDAPVEDAGEESDEDEVSHLFLSVKPADAKAD